jgi:hypothetical protein
MRRVLSLALALTAIGSLQAQSPRFGIYFNLGVPSGEFREKIYAPTTDVTEPQIEGYDVGLGGQFTMSFPLQKNLAFRVGLGGMSTEGTNTASGYETIYLRHTMLSITGEIQLFFNDAYRHRGTYFLAGISADYERFERSTDDYWDSWSDPWATRKNRLGGIVGIGHSFYGASDIKFTTELSYRSTLTGDDPLRQEPHATNLIKVSFGFVF